MQINDNRNHTNFNGYLTGQIGNHSTKKIFCCIHGDKKFVKFATEIATNNPKNIKISTKDGFNKHLILETTELPKVNFLEKIFFITNKTQRKALKWREEGKIEKFTYDFSDKDYKNLKENGLFVNKKMIKRFETAMNNIAPKNMQEYLNSFFNR